MAFFFLVLNIIILSSDFVLAQASQGAAVYQYTPSSYFWVLFRTTISLLIILGVLFISAKFFLKKSSFDGGGADFFIYKKIILEPQVSIYLLKAGPKIFLVGVGGKRITLIESLPEQDFPVKEALSEKSGADKFRDIFKKISAGLKERKNEE